MNNKFRLGKVLLWTGILACVILTLRMPLKTRQCVDGAVAARPIPCYVKISEFMCRHYEYGALARRITAGVEGDRERVTALYRWTLERIKRRPEGFPHVDDHIWNVIVRGYGTNDQMADVFTTLASYAGYRAFWEKIVLDSTDGGMIISFVRVGAEWAAFDVYNRKAFIRENDYETSTPNGPAYGAYLEAVDDGAFLPNIRRPDKQKPLPRVAYELRKLLTGRK